MLPENVVVCIYDNTFIGEIAHIVQKVAQFHGILNEWTFSLLCNFENFWKIRLYYFQDGDPNCVDSWPSYVSHNVVDSLAEITAVDPEGKIRARDPKTKENEGKVIHWKWDRH